MSDNIESSSEGDSLSDNDYNQKVLKKVREAYQSDNESSEEEVYGMENSSTSEDDDEDDKLSNAESDIVDINDDLPDDRAWGKKKNIYYSTDGPDDRKSRKRKADDDIDEAQLEEEEATRLQQRLLSQFDDDDFSLDIYHSNKTETKKDVENYIKTDISQMVDGEKLQLLKEESPELLGLIADLKDKLREVAEVLGPVLDSTKNKNNSNIKSLRLRYNLILKYVSFINYYLLLKSLRVNVKNHPVVQQIIKYRTMCDQIKDVVDEDIKLINQEKQASNKIKKAINTKTKTPKAKVQPEKKKKSVEFNKRVEVKLIEPILEEKKAEEVVPEDEIKDSKRAITYQMAKNKGLTPKRKKEQRNPRVKNRNKFRKATIRRKGAVRNVRKELVRYGGEVSGIKTSVVKSVKIK